MRVRKVAAKEGPKAEDEMCVFSFLCSSTLALVLY